MTRIIGFSGAKQSGKTTCCKFLHGYQMRLFDSIEKFLMDTDGCLIINAIYMDDKGEETEGLGILDIDRRDPEFIEYASNKIWPFVQSFSFADPLKAISMQLFGLTEEQCFGTDEQKNTPININGKTCRFMETDLDSCQLENFYNILEQMFVEESKTAFGLIAA